MCNFKSERSIILFFSVLTKHHQCYYIKAIISLLDARVTMRHYVGNVLCELSRMVMAPSITVSQVVYDFTPL